LGEPALLDITGAVSVAAKDGCAMRVVSELMPQRKPWRSLLALCTFLGAISVAIGGAVHAQNLDQGKSAPKLFADGCASCHRSARGLAKGRFSLTLFLFLQDHYASNSSSAWALTSYLESVDSPERGRSRAAAARPSPSVTGTSRSSLRPPLPVPVR
jgi:mono/diheme cytochrome c family protein